MAACAVLIGCTAANAPGSAPDPPRSRLVELDGREIDPFATRAPAHVFVFLRSDCPISNRYAPEIRRIAEHFSAEGVAFWFVYPDPEEPIEKIRDHFAEYSYPGRPLRDPSQALVHLAGATVTPEAALYDGGDLRLAYLGRIDDRYVDFGKARAAPTRRDLVEAIEAVLHGRPVLTPRTKAVGCFIPAPGRAGRMPAPAAQSRRAAMRRSIVSISTTTPSSRSSPR